ncbi:MAG: RNA polymerase sigma factor [Planctomycetaceae bacterium]|nr:RNA polymerase sigma factor [Planctomycetaceae bacterium]
MDSGSEVASQHVASLPTGGDADAALVRLAKSGDLTAQSQLIQQWSIRILATCRAHIRDRQAAEDATQETLLRGFRAIHTLQDEKSFGSWLRGIAQNVCRDWLRKKQRRDGLVQEEQCETFADHRHDAAEAELNQQEKLRQLALAISDLPTPQQEVLNLFYFDEMSYDDIAALLQVARSTVNTRLATARESLRKALTTLEREH